MATKRERPVELPGNCPRGELIAYRGTQQAELLPEILPASRWRGWMEETSVRFANRCLPMLVANESGWVLINTSAFEAVWDGGIDTSAVRISFPDGQTPSRRPAESNFGYGILTFGVPYLFRTPPGYNLLARGPANDPKDGIGPLEGIVETDWATATFTMNWRFTRPDHPVRFEEGEPFCLILPQCRGDLEDFDPTIRTAGSDPEISDRVRRWQERREKLRIRKFLGRYSESLGDDRGAWEGDYFRGRDIDGNVFSEHQTKRRLRRFRS